MADQTVSDVSVTERTVTGMLFRYGTVSFPANSGPVSVSWDAFPNGADGLIVSPVSGAGHIETTFDTLTTTGAKLYPSTYNAYSMNWLVYGH